MFIEGPLKHPFFFAKGFFVVVVAFGVVLFSHYDTRKTGKVRRLLQVIKGPLCHVML